MERFVAKVTTARCACAAICDNGSEIEKVLTVLKPNFLCHWRLFNAVCSSLLGRNKQFPAFGFGANVPLSADLLGSEYGDAKKVSRQNALVDLYPSWIEHCLFGGLSSFCVRIL